MCTACAGLSFTSITRQNLTSLNSISFDTLTCPPLTLPNGTIRYNTPQLADGRFWVNTTPRFSCNSGYELNGVGLPVRTPESGEMNYQYVKVI